MGGNIPPFSSLAAEATRSSVRYNFKWCILLWPVAGMVAISDGAAAHGNRFTTLVEHLNKSERTTTYNSFTGNV